MNGSFAKTAAIVYPEILIKFDATATEAGLVIGIHGVVKMLSSKQSCYMALYCNFYHCENQGTLIHTINLNR